MSDIEIYQGDTVSLAYDLDPQVDMTGWTAQVMVKSSVAGDALIDMTLSDISADTFSVIGGLTKAQTAALSAGYYYVLAELNNADESLSKEIHTRMRVKLQGVS